MRLADVVLAKKWELDALRKGLRPDALDGLEHAQRIDITYTSNAIEGNTLTAGETALIIEKGITVAGKPLKDHLEAVDHAKALAWVLDIALQKDVQIREVDLRNLHRLVTAQSATDIAGRYVDKPRFVNTTGGIHNFPSPGEVPALMATFGQWLVSAPSDAATGFEAHLRLVGIHPFNDGNGRTARLLMNLILARAGYPPIAVRPEERDAYLASIEKVEAGKGDADLKELLFRRLEKTLDIYLNAARQASRASDMTRREMT